MGKISRKKSKMLTCKYLSIYDSLPKNYYFPPGVPYNTRINKFSSELLEENASEVTEHTVKHGSVAKNHVNKPKTGPTLPIRLDKNESVKT